MAETFELEKKFLINYSMVNEVYNEPLNEPKQLDSAE